MAYGVIGNTAGFGPVVLGSSPSRPTSKTPNFFEVGGFYFFVQYGYSSLRYIQLLEKVISISIRGSLY